MCVYISVQFSHSVMSDSLQPHGLQHSRPPCPSPTPGVYSNSGPLSQWCHPTISSSVVPFSSCLRDIHTHTHTHTHTFYVFITLKYYLDHILWHYPFNNHSSIGSSSSYACLSCLWFHLDSSFVILSSSFPGFLVSFPHTTLLIND